MRAGESNVTLCMLLWTLSKIHKLSLFLLYLKVQVDLALISFILSLHINNLYHLYRQYIKKCFSTLLSRILDLSMVIFYARWSGQGQSKFFS